MGRHRLSLRFLSLEISEIGGTICKIVVPKCFTKTTAIEDTAIYALKGKMAPSCHTYRPKQ